MRNIQPTPSQYKQIACMTNWQRHQWAKAGYPCGSKQASEFERFATMQRNKR